MKSLIKPKVFDLRPRFVIVSDLSIDELTYQFSKAFKEPNVKYSGWVSNGCINVYPISSDKHYWSPYFSLSMESSVDKNGQTVITGIYGPAPDIWTMFVFIYAIIGLSILIITVIGFANKSIGESSSILWAVPLLLMVLGSMYSASYFGQKKGHNQVEGIYHFIHETCLFFNKKVST